MENNLPIEQDPDLFPHGLFFAAPVLIVFPIFLLLALLYRQTELTILSLSIIFLGIGLRLWSRYSPRRLFYTLRLDQNRAFPGESVRLSMVIENAKLLPVLIKLRLMINPLLTDDQQTNDLSQDTNILSRQKLVFDRVLVPQKRGVFKTGASKLVTGDFFGFFPKLASADQNAELIVYPRLNAVRLFPVISRIMPGKPSQSSPTHDPVHILGTRDYQRNSPGKNIHWKASARLNKLQEKIFEPSEQEKLMIIFEVDGFIEENDEDRFEAAIEIIAALGIEFDANFYAVGFIANSRFHEEYNPHLVPTRRSSQVRELFEILARARFEANESIDDILARPSLIPTGATCVYFSYYPLSPHHPARALKAPMVTIVAKHREVHTNTGENVDQLRTLSMDDIRFGAMYERS